MKCEICWENKPVTSCRLCGRKVCDEDYDKERDVCKACSEAICQICDRNLSIGYCRICGRLVCDLCSIKNNVALVCVQCSPRFKGDDVAFSKP